MKTNYRLFEKILVCLSGMTIPGWNFPEIRRKLPVHILYLSNFTCRYIYSPEALTHVHKIRDKKVQVHFSTVRNRAKLKTINWRTQKHTAKYLYDGILYPSYKKMNEFVQCLPTWINLKNIRLKKSNLWNFMYCIILLHILLRASYNTKYYLQIHLNPKYKTCTIITENSEEWRGGRGKKSISRRHTGGLNIRFFKKEKKKKSNK